MTKTEIANALDDLKKRRLLTKFAFACRLDLVTLQRLAKSDNDQIPHRATMLLIERTLKLKQFKPAEVAGG